MTLRAGPTEVLRRAPLFSKMNGSAMTTRLRRVLEGLRRRLGHAGAPIEGGSSRRLKGAAMDWRVLLVALPDAAVVLDAQSRILEANVPFIDLYPDVRAGQPVNQWLRNPDLFDAIENAIGDGLPQVVVLLHRLPVERRIAARVVRLSERSAGDLRRGEPCLLVTFRDLTEQDKLAQMREDFIANASHELRTPLASLRGFIETLQGPARDDPVAQDRFLGVMAGQAERMTRLIDDLLSLSRVEMRAHVMPRGTVDLNEVAEYVLETLEPMAESGGAHLSVEASDGPARIRGERDEIVQVLTNFVNNAITYGGRGVQVSVIVTRVETPNGRVPRVRLAVKDNGPGISKEHLPRLTERFYRPSVAASRSKGGTGLGLAIVKHIVARHRGDLDIQSEFGKGSTFSVTFDAVA